MSNVRKESSEGGIYTSLHGQYCDINMPKIPALDSDISATLTRDLERLPRREEIRRHCSPAHNLIQISICQRTTLKPFKELGYSYLPASCLYVYGGILQLPSVRLEYKQRCVSRPAIRCQDFCHMSRANNVSIMTAIAVGCALTEWASLAADKKHLA